VHELGRDHSKTKKQLLDIATQHTSREEVVRAIFVQGDGKMILNGSRGGTAQSYQQGF
jgi:hypothetical protein